MVDPMGLEEISNWDYANGYLMNLFNYFGEAKTVNQPGLPAATIQAYKFAAADRNGRPGSADEALIQRGRDTKNFQNAMPLVASAAEAVVLFTVAPGLNIESGFAEGLNLVKGAKVIKEGEKTFVLTDARKIEITAKQAEQLAAQAKSAQIGGLVHAKIVTDTARVFANNGKPKVIVDASMESKALVEALRKAGYDAVTVTDLFGTSARVGDDAIRVAADSVGAKVLTRDRGRNMLDGGGFPNGIVVPNRIQSPSEIIRFVDNSKGCKP